MYNKFWDIDTMQCPGKLFGSVEEELPHYIAESTYNKAEAWIYMFCFFGKFIKSLEVDHLLHKTNNPCKYNDENYTMLADLRLDSKP